MLDSQTTKLGAEIVATAASSLFEDGATRASRAFHTVADINDAASELRALGQDIVTLAGALEVLARRADP